MTKLKGLFKVIYVIPLSVDEIFDIIKDTNVQEINQICKTLFHPDNTIIIIEGKVD